MSPSNPAAPPVTPKATQKSKTWPYSVDKKGRMVLQYEDNLGVTQNKIIADFTATITGEVVDEFENSVYIIEGKGKRSGTFKTEILADDFGETRKLKSILESKLPYDPVRANMAGHLGAAIKLLTVNSIKITNLFNHTGWQDGHFLIPGNEPVNTIIDLNRKQPYRVYDGDITESLQVLESLIISVGAEFVLPCIVATLQAPMARLVGWENERYGVFVAGRTGSLKTSVIKMVMCIYGDAFSNDFLLTKWGEGATRNSLMSMATQAHDLPFLIDNYKPNTGDGARGFVGLIHNILEGSEKDRLNRASQLMETKPIFCWPICTGEDVPDIDTATLARILVIQFPWQNGSSNDELFYVQENHKKLPVVGWEWIKWLQSADSDQLLYDATANYEKKRKEWLVTLKAKYPEMQNILRVASNIASNELTYELICKHPVLGPTFSKYTRKYKAGIDIIAGTMGYATGDVIEAMRFIDGLKEIISVDKAILKDTNVQNQPISDFERRMLADRMIGWCQGDDIYLVPKLTRMLIRRYLNDDLNKISAEMLYKQLDELGYVKSSDSGKKLLTKRIDGKPRKVLHMDTNKLWG